MGHRAHTAEFLKAVRGGRGELDAWLECNNEAECRAAIIGAMEEAAEAELERCAAAIRATGPSEGPLKLVTEGFVEATKKPSNADVTGLPPAQAVELPPKPAGGRSELT